MTGVMKPLFGTPLNLGHPLAQGLVGSWLLNEGSGNKAYDSSGQVNHGTLVNISNPPTSTSGWAAGAYGGGLLFNGVNNRIDIGEPAILDYFTAFTLVGFFTINNIGIDQSILSKYSSFQFEG